MLKAPATTLRLNALDQTHRFELLEQRLQQVKLLGLWLSQVHGKRKRMDIGDVPGAYESECLSSNRRQRVQAAVGVVIHNLAIRPPLN